MAYDEALGGRIRRALGGRPDVTERRMFGGLAFMVAGNMAVGVVGENLMVRVGPDGHDRALAEAHVRPMEMAGRPMRGFVYVEPAGLAIDRDLERWVGRGVSYAESLPAK